jgi:hypothetical protein
MGLAKLRQDTALSIPELPSDAVQVECSVHVKIGNDLVYFAIEVTNLIGDYPAKDSDLQQAMENIAYLGRADETVFHGEFSEATVLMNQRGVDSKVAAWKA